MSAAASPQEPTTSASPAAAAAGGDDDTIEAAAPDEAEDAGEFEPSEFDASSTTSGSVTSSVFHHSYENGRRVRWLTLSVGRSISRQRAGGQLTRRRASITSSVTGDTPSPTTTWSRTGKT